MKIKLSTLRKIIREEMERNLRWTAGIAIGGAGLNNPARGVKYGVPQGLGSEELPPPGLGSDTEDTEMENEEQEHEEASRDE